jgi:hypothetical protein
MIYVHYRSTDGEIDGYDTPFEPERRPGCAILQSESVPDRKVQKIDLVTLQIRDKTPAERMAADTPTELDVKAAVHQALWLSDVFMLSDYPITQPQQLAWTAYRKTLRDLSKGSPAPTPAAMIAAWPLDPNNNDAIAQLRARL